MALQLSSPSAGTSLPFCFGFAFRKGDIPSTNGVASTLPGLQVTPKNRWPDGSLKFAIVAGRATLAANSPLIITLSAGSADTRAALTTAELRATNVVASIACGTFGTVSWSGAAWDSPASQWVSGPEMSSWIYRKPVGTDAHLVAWLEVRLYAGGAVEVLPWVENGYLKVAGSTKKSGTFAFTLGSTQRFSGTVNLLHHQRTPLVSGTAVSYWLGTDPQITPKHNALYLAESGLVPGYVSGVTFAEFPAFPADAAGLYTTFTPLEQGNLPSAMGDGGPHPSIGLIANWDAAYLTSTSTLNAYKGMVFNVYRMGRYGVHFRDELTNRPVKFADRVQLAIDDADGTFKYGAYGSTTGEYTVGGAGGVPPIYSMAHHPSPGYVAYLMTGRYYMLEELQLTTGAQYLHRGWFRNGTDGRADTKYIQIREGAWAIRTLFQCTSATPDDDTLRPGYLNACTKNAEFQKSIFLDQTNHPFGIPVSGTGSSPPAAQCFEVDFWVMSWLNAVLMKVLTGTAQTNLEAYANYTARAIVSRLGGLTATEYHYADATCYRNVNINTTGPMINPCLTVTGYPPDTVTTGSGPFRTSWGDIYKTSMGFTNPGVNLPLQVYVDDPGGGWGGVHMASAMAVTVGISGAQAAWNRFIGASNYQTYLNGATFYRFVSFAGKPVTVKT
jgi:hypothetical protein